MSLHLSLFLHPLSPWFCCDWSCDWNWLSRVVHAMRTMHNSIERWRERNSKKRRFDEWECVWVRPDDALATSTTNLDTLVKTRGKMLRTKLDAVVFKSLTLIFMILPFDRFETSRQQALSIIITPSSTAVEIKQLKNENNNITMREILQAICSNNWTNPLLQRKACVKIP